MSRLLIFIASLVFSIALAAETTITYQGQLQKEGKPFNDSAGMAFRLFDSPSGGDQIGDVKFFTGVPVENGLFQIKLDFGAAAFDGNERWLEVEVAGVTLEPRQRITAVPTAIQALNARAQVLDDFYWRRGGNTGTDPSVDFLGTADGVPFEIHVDGQPALRIEPRTFDGLLTPNLIAGSPRNEIQDNARGATIAGGGSFNPNTVSGNFGAIGGGIGNTASSSRATVGGGIGNTASGPDATVGGGGSNTASGSTSTVPGGRSNTASGSHSTVPGGLTNEAAGDFSFAAGRRAKAEHDGAFVWADSANTDFISTGQDQFPIQAAGGVGIGTNSPDSELSVAGDVDIDRSLSIGNPAFDPGPGGLRAEGIIVAEGAFLAAFGELQMRTDSMPGGGNSVCRSTTGSFQSLGFCSSSQRYKTDIRDLAAASHLVDQLRAVAFRWKEDEREDFGLIAEEVAEVEPRLATFAENGQVQGVNYRHLSAVLVAAWQEQRTRTMAELARRDAEIGQLRDEIKRQRTETAERLAALEALLLDDAHLALE